MRDLKIRKFCIHATLPALKYLAYKYKYKATWPSLVMVNPFCKALALEIT